MDWDYNSNVLKEFSNLSISAAAGDQEVPRQELGLEHIGLVPRVELKHLPTRECPFNTTVKASLTPLQSKKG